MKIPRFFLLPGGMRETRPNGPYCEYGDVGKPPVLTCPPTDNPH